MKKNFLDVALKMEKENFERNDRAKHKLKNVGRVAKQDKDKKPLDF